MSTFRDTQTFFAYAEDGPTGALVTPLYDGQAPATKYLVDRLLAKYNGLIVEAIGSPPKWDDPKYRGTGREWMAYQKDYKAWDKARRKEAKAYLCNYTLVTYRLVRNV